MLQLDEHYYFQFQSSGANIVDEPFSTFQVVYPKVENYDIRFHTEYIKISSVNKNGHNQAAG